MTIEIQTPIKASIQLCFDLSRNIDIHTLSTAHTGEEAVGGVTSGLIGLGEQVTWRAKHFGIWQKFTSKITAFNSPYHFRDEMLKGAFKRFEHDHWFIVDGEITLVKDRLEFEAPLGYLGRIAERAVLKKHLTNFLIMRNEFIKNVAEGILSEEQLLSGNG